MPTHISAADLRAADACARQLRKFIELFGEAPVEVTEEVCAAVAEKFNFSWAGEHLLRGEARAEFERQMVPLWAEYERQTAPLWAEYDRQTALLWVEYKRQTARLFARCYRDMP